MATDLLTTLTKVNKPLFGVLGLFFLCQSAFAHPPQLPCGPHDQLVEVLVKDGLTVQGNAITDNGLLAEVYANPKTGTWVWIVTNPSKLTCILQGGNSWQDLSGTAS